MGDVRGSLLSSYKHGRLIEHFIACATRERRSVRVA